MLSVAWHLRPRLARDLLWLGILPAVVISAIVFSPDSCFAESDTDVVKVEEYWDVDLHTPDPGRGSPQLNFLISTTGNSSGLYAVFIVNQRDGAIGGLQLQLWDGESLLASSAFSDTSALGTSDEQISWKTRLRVAGGSLTVEIVGLRSVTWGSYDTDTVVPGLSVTIPRSLGNLNGYNLNVSADNFGIDFGNNRVKKVTLEKVLLFTGNDDFIDQLGDEKVIYDNP